MATARTAFTIEIHDSFDGWTVYSDEMHTDIVRDGDLDREVAEDGDAHEVYSDWCSRTESAPREVYAEAARRLDWEGINSGAHGWVARA